jgi:SAM-dependent methyltransferase
MTSLIEHIDDAFYPGVGQNWDDALFRERIQRHLRADSVALDFGAGAGIVKEMNFKSAVARMCGIDIDPRVMRNPMLHEAKLSDGTGIPYGDETFDLVFADNVLEHLSAPATVFSEIHRVLKPGGLFLFKTPNKWHYMPVIARFTPHWFHQWVNRERGRLGVDTFPTLYRANSVTSLRKLATAANFEVLKIERVEGRPEYLRVTWPTYLIGVLYERLVSSVTFLAVFRVLLIGQLRKPA